MIELKNMKEMPKSCRECQFYWAYCYDADGRRQYDGHCKLLSSPIRCAAYSTRYYDCPLKEVREPVLTDEEILDAIFCDFCEHIDGGESNLRGVNDIEFVDSGWNHDMNSAVRISFTDGSSLIYRRNADEV